MTPVIYERPPDRFQLRRVSVSFTLKRMTLPLRTVVFWMHLCAGLFAGAVVLVMSVTGVLLTYEKQMIRWADGYQAAPTGPDQARLPLDEIVARGRAARPDAPAPTVTVRRAADAPVELAFGRDGSVFLDPYTGQVMGTGSPGIRAFFRSVTNWHRWVAMEGPNRPLGKSITGISNLAFFFIVISGFYLWWPRTWTWKQFKQVLLFRGGLPSKARDFNWHNVIGFWSLVPLAVIVWSGVVIGYPWASNLTYRMVGEAPPVQAGPGGGPGGRPGGGPGGPGGQAAGRAGNAGAAPAGSANARAERGPDAGAAGAPRGEAPAPRGDRAAASPEAGAGAATATDAPGDAFLSLDALVARAQQRDANWTIISLRAPGARDRQVQVTVDSGTGAQPQKRGTLTLDRATGSEAKWEHFTDQSRGRQWRMWMRFAHTGEYYGLVGQTIAGLVTFGSIVLVYTGIALTWRRFTAWRGRRNRTPHRAAA